MKRILFCLIAFSLVVFNAALAIDMTERNPNTGLSRFGSNADLIETIDKLPKCTENQKQGYCRDALPDDVSLACRFMNDFEDKTTPYFMYCAKSAFQMDDWNAKNPVIASYETVELRTKDLQRLIEQEKKFSSPSYWDRLNPQISALKQLKEIPDCDSKDKRNLCYELEEQTCKPECVFFRDLNSPEQSFCSYCETSVGGDGTVANKCYASDKERNKDVLNLIQTTLADSGCMRN